MSTEMVIHLKQLQSHLFGVQQIHEVVEKLHEMLHYSPEEQEFEKYWKDLTLILLTTSTITTALRRGMRLIQDFPDGPPPALMGVSDAETMNTILEETALLFDEMLRSMREDSLKEGS